MSRVRWKEVGSLTVGTAATRGYVDLPRGNFLSRIGLTLHAQIDRAAGASDGTCRDSAPGQLVNQIELEADGANVIRRVPMWMQHRLNQLDYGNRPKISGADLQGYAAITNGVFECTCYLDFERPRTMPWNVPIETLLDTRGMTSLKLWLTWGAIADIMNAAFDGTVTLDSASVDVHVLERVQNVDKTGVGEFAGRVFPTIFENVETIPVTSSTEMEIKLTSPGVYQDIVLFTVSDGDLVNTILPYSATSKNKIKLMKGGEVWWEMYAGNVQRNMRLDHQIAIPELTASAAAINHGNTENILTGMYAMHFPHDMNLREVADFRKAHDVKLIVDAAHVGTNDYIYIYKRMLALPEGVVLQPGT